MRLTAAVPFAAVAVLGLACAKPSLLATSNTVTVSVSILCEGDSVRTSVSPFSVQVGKTDTAGDEVAWEASGSSTVSEIEITQKTTDKKKWPFDDTLPLKGNKKEPGKSGRMKKNAAEGSYGYNIGATCTLASGAVAHILIDPDMIIIHRTM